MILIPLQSGSNGNCIYVESGSVRLLFDAGISASLTAARLREHGRELYGIDALFISHDHANTRAAAASARSWRRLWLLKRPW